MMHIIRLTEDEVREACRRYVESETDCVPIHLTGKLTMGGQIPREPVAFETQAVRKEHKR